MEPRASITQRAQQATERIERAYTPDIPIRDPALFSGRAKLLERCRRLLPRLGVTLLLYGERGIGKTSFCNVLLHDKRSRSWQASSGNPQELFVTILASLGIDLTVSERTYTGRAGITAPVNLGGEISETRVPIAPRASDVNFLVERLGNVDLDMDAIVIDEVQEIREPAGRLWLAALAKAWSDAGARPLLVFIGAGNNPKDLLGDEVEHYGARHIHAEHVTPLSGAEARDILARREALGVGVKAKAGKMALNVADGQPWRVQRVMLEAVLNGLRDHPPEVGAAGQAKARQSSPRLLRRRGGRAETGDVDIEMPPFDVTPTDVWNALDDLHSRGHAWAETSRSGFKIADGFEPPQQRMPTIAEMLAPTYAEQRRPVSSRAWAGSGSGPTPNDPFVPLNWQAPDPPEQQPKWGPLPRTFFGEEHAPSSEFAGNSLPGYLDTTPEGLVRHRPDQDDPDSPEPDGPPDTPEDR